MSTAVTGARPGASWRSLSADWVPLGAASLVFCALIALGAGGVRGTDQFWYVADAARLADGGPATTNQAFPVSVLEGLELPRPFVHNGPALYFVAAVAKWIGSYRAWVVLGVLFSLLTALLIAREVGGRTTGRTGSWAGAAYLALPLTIWQASQPLLEAWLAFLVVAGGVLVAAPDRRAVHWLLATLVAGVLCWSRFTFIPILVGMPVAFAIVHRSDLRQRWHVLLLLLVLAAGFVILEPVLFRPHQPFTFGEYVNGTVTWKDTDMLFVRPDATVALSTIFRKAVSAMVQQFWPDIPASMLFYWPFTLGVAAFGFLLLRSRDRWTAWSIVTVSLVALHLATIVLYRNQFRYVLPVTPPLLICLAVWSVGWWRSAVWKRILAAAMIGGVCAGAVLMLHSRAGGKEARKLRHRLEDVYASSISDRRPVLVQYPQAGGFIHAFVLRPRLVGYIDGSLERAELDTIRSRLDAGWVVTSDPDPWSHDSLRLVAPVPVGDTLEVGLYRFEDGP